MSRPIFISHSSKDKELADALSKLLESGMGIRSSQIFCTSLEGKKIPSGMNVVEFIKNEIVGTHCVIMLLTANYFESSFCLCEMGAAWALSQEIAPILVPPLQFNDVQAVMKGVQLSRLEAKEDLDDLYEVLSSIPGIERQSVSHWQKRKEQFLSELDELIEALPTPSRVSPDEHNQLVLRVKKLERSVTLKDKAIKELESKYERIKTAVTSRDVRQIELEDSEETEKFDALVAAAKDAMKSLPKTVQQILFHGFGKALYFTYADRVYHWTVEELDSYVNNRLISFDEDDRIYANESHPKVSPASDALNDLASFLRFASEDFKEWYAEEYEHEPRMDSLEFWEEHLLS